MDIVKDTMRNGNKKILITLVAIAVAFGVYAQDTVMIGAKVHVTPGTIVSIGMTQTTVNDSLNNFGDITILGNFTNSPAGQIFNDDTIYVAGNWTNVTGGKYRDDLGQGTVVFDGISPQIISQSITGGDFYHVAFTGGGVKTLSGYMFIDSTVNFDNGNLLIGATDTIMLREGDVIGGSPLSHCVGFFYHRGVGELRFPIGEVGLTYREATLLNVPDPGSAPFIGMQFRGLAHTGTPGPNIHTLENGYAWRLHVRGGAYNGSKIKLMTRPTDGFTDSTQIVIAQSGTRNGEYMSIGNSDFDATSVTSTFNAVDTFFTFGRSANMNAQVAALLQGDMDGASTMYDSLFVKGELDQYLDGNVNALGINMLPGYPMPIVAGRGPVDYISLYLRTTPTGSNLDTTYCWLMSDGSIRDFYTGTKQYATFTNYTTLTSGSDYHVVVDHRNHIPVMYSLASTVDTDTTALITFDVTKITNIYGAGAYQPDATGNNVQMFSGNSDVNTYFYSKYIVDADDFDKVRIPANNGMPSGYLDEDVNLDGNVNGTDWDITKTGVDNMYYSTVPF